MHMSFEKIDPPAPPAETKREHPAARAARMIRDYHQETITKIDSGFIFTREGVDCNAELRAACVEHIACCEEVIARAETGDMRLHDEAMAILHAAEV